MTQRWWLLLERAQATLPLLVAGALAGFTWWLVQSSPKPSGPGRPQVASSAPDYVLDKARVARVDAKGLLEAVMDGQVMRHFSATDILLVDQLVLSARDEKGEALHAVSREGEADHRAELVTLRGGANVVAYPSRASEPADAAASSPRTSPVHFTGEILKVDTHNRVVSSDLPVLLTQEHSRIQGDTMVYNDATGIADLHGRVRGHYATPAEMKAGLSAP